MMTRRKILLWLVGGLVSGGLWSASGSLAAEEQKKDEKRRGGTVVGLLVSKGENFINVKAAGEERARRYVPHWTGGLPKDGGGHDPKMLKQIKELEVGSRLRIEWEFEERPRVIKIEVLQKPDSQDR